MVKKLGTMCAIVLISLCVVSGVARADGLLVTDVKYTIPSDSKFDIGADLWLWLDANTCEPQLVSSMQWWSHNTDTYWSFTMPTVPSNTWYKFDDLSFTKLAANGSVIGTDLSWDNDVKALGHWDIKATVSAFGGDDCCCGNCNYYTGFDLEDGGGNVPEPISSTLFLLGGGALATHLLRKNKKGKS